MEESTLRANWENTRSGDKRYKFVAAAWQAGHLAYFIEIFDIVPRSVIASDMGINYERFTKRVLNPEILTYRDIRRLSVLLDIPFEDLSKLIVSAIQTNGTPISKHPRR